MLRINEKIILLEDLSPRKWRWLKIQRMEQL